ncbi:MAG: response regulator [Actinomycetota bacterium]|nr:response regulator [Actinomycetota bacterium]
MSPSRILLVEDNEADVELFSESLDRTRFDVHVTVARDGVEAIERLEAIEDGSWPDLVFLDLNLPRLNGRDLLGRVKTDVRLRGVPILVLSSSDAPDDVGACYALGANCYLTKPVEFSRYRELIQQAQEFWLHLAQLPDGPG